MPTFSLTQFYTDTGFVVYTYISSLTAQGWGDMMGVTNEFEAHRVHIKPEGNFGEPGQGPKHEPGGRKTYFCFNDKFKSPYLCKKVH